MTHAVVCGGEWTMTTNVRVADQIIEQLEREGVTHIFGVPGAPLTPFFAALRARDRIKFVMARHEEGAAYMANSFARVSGRLAVCCVTSGPGATNALTGAACAHADSLPVLYLTGQVATRVFGMGAIQESTVHGVDVVSVFRPVTKLSTMLSSPETSLRMVRNAIRAATSGRPGPVHINVPTDLARTAVAYDVLDRSCYQQALKSVASARDIASAASLLSAAKRPTIFAGHGVALANAESALVQLAERLDAAVITSPKGKGVFPEHHPLSLGVFGMGGHARADAWLESQDVILVVGSSLNEFASGAWNRRLRAERGVIQIDVDASEIGKNYPVAMGLHGDAGETLTALRLALGAATERGTQRRIAEISATVPRWEQDEHRRSSSAPIAPPRLVVELRSALPEDAMLFVDTGNASLWAGHHYEARAPRSYFIDMGLAAMGSAVAGVVGGAIAAPNRVALCLTGDAAFAMNGFEVHVAAELGLRVIWVVLDNAGHGMIQQGERLAFGNDHGYYAFEHRIDAAAIARGLGVAGVDVDSPGALRVALHEAIARRGPTVINARIDATVVAPTLDRRARSVAEFFGTGAPAGPAGAG